EHQPDAVLALRAEHEQAVLRGLRLVDRFLADGAVDLRRVGVRPSDGQPTGRQCECKSGHWHPPGGGGCTFGTAPRASIPAVGSRPARWGTVPARWGTVSGPCPGGDRRSPRPRGNRDPALKARAPTLAQRRPSVSRGARSGDRAPTRGDHAPTELTCPARRRDIIHRGTEKRPGSGATPGKATGPPRGEAERHEGGRGPRRGGRAGGGSV